MISTMFSSASLAAVTSVVMFLLTYMPYVIVIAMEATMSFGWKFLIVSYNNTTKNTLQISKVFFSIELTFRLIILCFYTVFEHVDMFLIRMSVHRETRGARIRFDLGCDVGRNESW